MHPLLANLFYETQGGRMVLHAMPILLFVLCVLAIAYRYYSAFLAAKVAALDDARETPAHRFYDGQNYHPTNKWVLFGHHFAAISGAGPLIGPVLAIQYGYMPGLLWLVIGVCLAGAVQDMLVLAASVRRGGKSLAQIALTELGRPAAVVVSAAILFIVIIALAGLGFVVVKALGGEEVMLPANLKITLPAGGSVAAEGNEPGLYRIPKKASIHYPGQKEAVERSESFLIQVPAGQELQAKDGVITLPPKSALKVKGSSWGTFTIACTIPIALFVGLYMYRIRKGRVVEASLIGAAAVLAATVLGGLIPGSSLEDLFSLTKTQTVLALTAYGFVASVLPVWMLLCPRDYLSSFLKIGTIILLVAGVLIANPTLPCPEFNSQFAKGGPTFNGGLFPFVFICIMCGAISGFHALVASGTTPKMIDKESQVRMIGYGAMLMEGLVGIVALIAAASLNPRLYYDINVDLNKTAAYQDDLKDLYKDLKLDEKNDPLARTKGSLHDLNLDEVEDLVGGESLRGRTGGAVTLAVGMALVFTQSLDWAGDDFVKHLMQFWYHFAIMFEALFILTTIDTGTRIARFLLQEALGKAFPKFERTDWLPGAIFATLLVTAGWGILIQTGSIYTIWPMFGIANQLLSVVALALVTTLLINSGRARYAPLTILPMLFVCATTLTAGAEMLFVQFPMRIQEGQTKIGLGEVSEGNQLVLSGILSIVFALFVITCVALLLLMAISRWVGVLAGFVPAQTKET